ncbi:transcription initiation factor IIB family protein [Natronoarchaeum sp. GCM10025703]|uniref:transcription initiation factor IIB n=1 Tax=unclassified Natronoarchaeum TaxID=2620183 RepID=UPI00360A15ED
MSLRDVYETGFDEDDGQTTNRTACPECDGGLQTVGGETTCTECGVIVDEYRIDHAAAKRSFAGGTPERTRTGAPLTPARHDRGLSTEIGRRVDANGNSLSSRKRRQLHRLRRQHGRARYRSKKERNLVRACGEIARLVGALDLTRSRREEASVIFRRAHEEDLLRGRSVESTAAGSVYAACRCSGELLTIVGRRCGSRPRNVTLL